MKQKILHLPQERSAALQPCSPALGAAVPRGQELRGADSPGSGCSRN